MPPKHDLSGGNASEDSFVISNNVLTASINRCFLAVGRQRAGKDRISRVVGISQELGAVSVLPPDGGRLRRIPDIERASFELCSSEGGDRYVSGRRYVRSSVPAPTVC
jgi:hypothetical protein